MTKDEVFNKIKAIIAARAAGERDQLKDLIAEGASYSVAARDGDLPGFPVKSDDVGTAVDKLIRLIEYKEVDYDLPIIDGLRAAVVMNIKAESNGVPFDLRLCGMWEFDADGRAISLVEYTDTAAMRDWLAGGGEAITVELINPAS
jgi:ketosteroid isomerase-like protein